jgi:chemotaxis protein methyltransferase CheR
MYASTSAAVPGMLSDQHFAYLSNLIETKVGIRLPPNKRTMVEGRLRKRLKALGIANVEAYGDYIFENGALDAELPHLIDCMTTNKTDFFREPNHFNILVDRILPELLGGALPGQGHHIKIWSAASSIGAEAFTIAMVLDQALRGYPRSSYSVLGTDISTDVLRQASRAIYPLEMIAPVPSEMQRRYFMRAREPGRAEVRVVPELRRNVSFRHLNLMDATYPVDRDMDVIFCRNILIYFAKPIQDAVVTRLVSHLRPGGHLILGHSESMAGGNQPAISQVVPTVFRKNTTTKEQNQCQPAQKHRYAS